VHQVLEVVDFSPLKVFIADAITAKDKKRYRLV
jgi:hypothetical protein